MPIGIYTEGNGGEMPIGIYTTFNGVSTPRPEEVEIHKGYLHQMQRRYLHGIECQRYLHQSVKCQRYLHWIQWGIYPRRRKSARGIYTGFNGGKTRIPPGVVRMDAGHENRWLSTDGNCGEALDFIQDTTHS